MPAVRLSRRRRSSLALAAFQPAKPGYYGIHAPSPRPVTFAPNVTPGTYVETDAPSTSSSPEPESPTSKLFPPSDLPAPPPSRRRVPPGKRRSLGYIPRPPNAFMLFRADFVRQKHVPGSIETNHGSLSKIIGNCWRSLPLDEKKVWEIKAKHAKAEHKARYPEYRFRPVHNKNKDKKKDKVIPTVAEERRCEEVAQLLLEGKKGEQLAAAVRTLDHARSATPSTPLHNHHLQQPMYYPRRPSSVPLPNADYSSIMLPILPYFDPSRPAPSARQGSFARPGSFGQMSRSDRMILGQRRVSSARPYNARSWGFDSAPIMLQRDESPLPEVDTSLFEPSFLEASNQFSFAPQQHDSFNFHQYMTNVPPHSNVTHDLISPIDNIHTQQHQPTSTRIQYPMDPPALPELDPMTWLPVDTTHSDPSSTYSGSPAASDMSLPLHAPQPQHPNVASGYEIWKGMPSTYNDQSHAHMGHVGGGGGGGGGHVVVHDQQSMNHLDLDIHLQSHQHHELVHAFEQEMEFNAQQGCGGDLHSHGQHGHGHYEPGLESLFESSFGGEHVMNQDTSLGYDYQQMVHEY